MILSIDKSDGVDGRHSGDDHPYDTFFNNGMEYPRIQKSMELKAKQDGDEDEDEERGELESFCHHSPARDLPLFPFPGLLLDHLRHKPDNTVIDILFIIIQNFHKLLASHWALAVPGYAAPCEPLLTVWAPPPPPPARGLEA